MADKELITAGDKPIFYRLEGTGKPVVLIHGFAEDAAIWNRQLTFFKNKFLFIVPDLPGSGKSPFHPKLSTIDDYAEVIMSILVKESVARCTMIGHSMGGYITLAFAEKYPELLNSFGLFHSTAYADTEEKRNTRRKGIEFIRQYGSAKFLEQSIPNLFSENFKAKHQDIVKQIIQQYANFNPDSLVAYYEAMMKRPDRTDVLRNFQKPVMFIIGLHDTAIPLKDSLEQCHLPELSYIHIAKNSGHMGMLEETDWCNQVLEKFLLGV